MSNYNPITNFETKDSLTTGDPEKVILGTDLQAEFDAIAAAIESKAEQTEVTELINAITELEEGDPIDDDDFAIIEQNDTVVKLNANYLSLVRINEQTGTSYTLALTDLGKCVEMNNAEANTLTIPPNSLVEFPVHTTILVRQMGAGQTTIAAGDGVTIRTPSTLDISAQYGSISLHKRDTNEWCVDGALAAE